MIHWTPVTNLPPLNTPVLVTDGKQILVGQLEKFYDEINWEASGVEGYEWEWDFDANPLTYLITHWRPLPPLPGENE